MSTKVYRIVLHIILHGRTVQADAGAQAERELSRMETKSPAMPLRKLGLILVAASLGSHAGSRYRPAWESPRPTPTQHGLTTPSSASTSIGVPTRSRHSIRNGIRATC